MQPLPKRPDESLRQRAGPPLQKIGDGLAPAFKGGDPPGQPQLGIGLLQPLSGPLDEIESPLTTDAEVGGHLRKGPVQELMKLEGFALPLRQNGTVKIEERGEPDSLFEEIRRSQSHHLPKEPGDYKRKGGGLSRHLPLQPLDVVAAAIFSRIVTG